MPLVGDAVDAVVVEDGVWMRRSPIRRFPAMRSPAARSSLSRSLRRVRDGQENIPPWGSGWRRKSPLPEWYRRTPLRDISIILKALERRKLRMEAAAAQQRAFGIDPESQPQLLFSSSPVPRDAVPSGQVSSIQKPSSDISETVIDSTVVATTTTQPTGKALQIIPTPVSLFGNSLHTTVYLPQKTTSAVANLPAEDSKPSESGKKLLSSIDVIERAVRENLKRRPKGPSRKKTTRTRTLMSMR